jgi:hypothetical protein
VGSVGFVCAPCVFQWHCYVAFLATLVSLMGFSLWSGGRVFKPIFCLFYNGDIWVYTSQTGFTLQTGLSDFGIHGFGEVRGHYFLDTVEESTYHFSSSFAHGVGGAVVWSIPSR